MISVLNGAAGRESLLKRQALSREAALNRYLASVILDFDKDLSAGTSVMKSPDIEAEAESCRLKDWT